MNKLILSILVAVILILGGIIFIINFGGEAPNDEIVLRSEELQFKDALQGFGLPDKITTNWSMHSKDCKEPLPPQYFNVENTNDAYRIIDSLINFHKYCCDVFEKQVKAGNIIFIYNYSKKDSSALDLELTFDRTGIIIKQKGGAVSEYPKVYPKPKIQGKKEI